MIPVTQTTFLDGTDGKESGNCLAACIASILELSLEEVPNFVHPPQFTSREAADQWWCDTGWHELQKWLAPRGFHYLDFGAPQPWDPSITRTFGYHIVGGMGARGLRHVCVAYGDQIVHDPHPSRAGLISIDHYAFLVPLNAASFAPASRLEVVA